jgi:hypothetical protein
VSLCRLRPPLLFIVYLSLFVLLRCSLQVFSVFVLLVYISARCVLRVDRQSIISTSLSDLTYSVRNTFYVLAALPCCTLMFKMGYTFLVSDGPFTQDRLLETDSDRTLSTYSIYCGLSHLRELIKQLTYNSNRGYPSTKSALPTDIDQ